MNKNVRRIILILNIIIIIVILGYLIYSFFIKYKHDDEQFQIVNFNGYQFKVDNDLTFETKNDSILVGTVNAGWNATITIMNDPNNVVFSDINRMNEVLRFKGFDISDAVVHVLDDRQYVTFERRMSDDSLVPYVLFGYYKTNDSQICEIMLNDNIDVNKYNYDAFERVVKLLSDAEYDSEKDKEYHYVSLTLKGTLQALYGEEATSEKVE